jgi:hypothetical protein
VDAHRGANTAATVLQGKSVGNVTTVSDNVFSSYNSTSFANVPNAAATVTVPKGQSIVLVQFNTITQCSSSTGVHGNCRLRVIVDGVQAPPGDVAVAGDTEFGSECHSVDASIGPLAVGTHNVLIQARVSATFITMTVDDWHMTVMRIKA